MCASRTAAPGAVVGTGAGMGDGGWGDGGMGVRGWGRRRAIVGQDPTGRDRHSLRRCEKPINWRHRWLVLVLKVLSNGNTASRRAKRWHPSAPTDTLFKHICAQTRRGATCCIVSAAGCMVAHHPISPWPNHTLAKVSPRRSLHAITTRSRQMLVSTFSTWRASTSLWRGQQPRVT